MADDSRDFSDQWVTITGREAFQLLETEGTVALALRPDRIVGRPNHLELVAQIGDRNMLRIQIWTDSTMPHYALGVPFIPNRVAGMELLDRSDSP